MISSANYHRRLLDTFVFSYDLEMEYLAIVRCTLRSKVSYSFRKECKRLFKVLISRYTPKVNQNGLKITKKNKYNNKLRKSKTLCFVSSAYLKL